MRIFSAVRFAALLILLLYGAGLVRSIDAPVVGTPVVFGSVKGGMGRLGKPSSRPSRPSSDCACCRHEASSRARRSHAFLGGRCFRALDARQ